MQIPRLPATGENLKKYLMDTIKSILNYLHASRVRPGYGIDVQETPSGTIISIVKKQTSGASSSSGGGTTQDISATVSGGTAFIGLSGSTSSVEFVGTGDVEISGNTNGQIEIEVTGSGMPIPVSSPVTIRLDNAYHIMQRNGWARMTAIIDSLGNSANPASAYLRVIRSGVTTDHLVCYNAFLTMEGATGGSLMIPVVSGSTVQAYIDMDSNYSIAYSISPNEILIYD